MHEYNHKITGEVIRELRQQQGLSQEVLSGFATIARSHLSMIETGAKSPSLQTLWKICDALEMKPSELVAMIEERIMTT